MIFYRYSTDEDDNNTRQWQQGFETQLHLEPQVLFFFLFFYTNDYLQYSYIANDDEWQWQDFETPVASGTLGIFFFYYLHTLLMITIIATLRTATTTLSP